MTLPNCKCGEAAASYGVNYDGVFEKWEIHCYMCSICIYAPTQKQAESLWTDAMEAPELREKIKRMEEVRDASTCKYGDDCGYDCPCKKWKRKDGEG